MKLLKWSLDFLLDEIVITLFLKTILIPNSNFSDLKFPLNVGKYFIHKIIPQWKFFTPNFNLPSSHIINIVVSVHMARMGSGESLSLFHKTNYLLNECKDRMLHTASEWVR